MNARDHIGKPCYWRRRAMLPPMNSNQHPLSATVDHVRSRPECVTKREYIDGRNKVPACFECNQRRSREWINRYEAGLVFRTPFAVSDKNKRKAQREKTREGQARAEMRAVEKAAFNRPGILIRVAAELSEAWGD